MAARKPLVVGNWKMNKTVSEGIALVRELSPKVSMIHGVEIGVCPGFLALSAVGQALEGSNIALGAQDCYWVDAGAFTGEVSPAQLRDVGCKYVILGHSERRRQFGETSEQVKRKLDAVFRIGLIPILCVGESLEERNAGRTHSIVSEQAEQSIGQLGAAEAARLVMAYEPVWAIGTGKTATPEQAQEVHATLREILGKLLGKGTAAQTRLLYGGSVKGSNAKELMAKPDVDGALVGGASLLAAEFTAIVAAKA